MTDFNSVNKWIEIVFSALKGKYNSVNAIFCNYELIYFIFKKYQKI